MAILAMSPMGVLPMICCFFFGTTTTKTTTRTGETPVILMGKMPLLHSGLKFPQS